MNVVAGVEVEEVCGADEIAKDCRGPTACQLFREQGWSRMRLVGEYSDAPVKGEWALSDA